MRILALGDIVGTRTVTYLEERLWNYRRSQRIDFVIANGENTSEIKGCSAREAERLLQCGIDVLTLGNHAFGQRDLYPILERSDRIIRPANFPPTAPGMGYTVADGNGWRILCINVNGRAFMDAYADPFAAVEQILAREDGKYDYAVLDIHAEATSEKLALAQVFDGRIHVMFGTHTHVTTADESILAKGSCYQTDLGMSGPTNGILGTNSECVIEKFRTQMPTRFSVADGEIAVHGTIFDPDRKTAERIKF